MKRADLPIGVFDSGLGGLTVARAITALLPDERVLYLGDTARVPYGTRSASTVVRYAQGCGRALVKRGIKALVVACNTVSAVALDALRAELDLPVLGVIEPGARAAVLASKNLRIGVLGTLGTIASGAYPRAILGLSTRAEVSAHAAPLLVPLVEEGWLEGAVPELAVERYLQPLEAAKIDTLVLGCTHYPMLLGVIEAVCARRIPGTQIVDGALSTARELQQLLVDRSLERGSPNEQAPAGELRLLVTDMPTSFATMTARFLGGALPHVEVIDL